MNRSVSFPLFVFEKDDCSMFLVETPDKVLYHLEPIDIENDEYPCLAAITLLAHWYRCRPATRPSKTTGERAPKGESNFDPLPYHRAYARSKFDHPRILQSASTKPNRMLRLGRPVISRRNAEEQAN
jgi:hypothetical protein